MRIPYIDDISNSKTTVKRHIGGCQVCDSFVIARPEEASGLLKIKNRIIQAISVLKGESVSVKFHT